MSRDGQSDSAPPRPLGLFGGTFDPIHYGHLRSAWEAALVLDLDVRLMPANVPPHRPQPRASAAARLAMLRLALQGQSRLQIDPRELDRAGPSYTVDSLRELRAELGHAASLVVLLGADAFAGLPSWHRWRELFELAHIGVLTRPGHAPVYSTELAAVVDERRCVDSLQWRQRAAGCVLTISVTPLEISATDIRRRLALGEEPRFLLPDAVLEAIRENGWYAG